MANISIEDLIARAGQPVPLSVPTGLKDDAGDDLSLDVTFEDPCDESVLAKYHEEKAEKNDDDAGYSLWKRCTVRPESLVSDDNRKKLPTAFKTNLSQMLLDLLGNERFFEQRQRLIAEATALAISRAATSDSSNSPEGSTSLPIGSKRAQLAVTRAK